MYYSNYPSPEETLDVIKSLAQLKLGSLQANRPFFDRIRGSRRFSLVELYAVSHYSP